MKGRITVKVYKGRNSGYFWRVTSHNGKKIAIGGEPYVRRSGAMKAAKHFITMIQCGLYDIEGEEGEVK